MKPKLLSPRGYLSWTQIDLWERSPQRYIERYMRGGPDIRSDRMDFGSKVATALETGEETDDEIVNTLVALLPKYRDRDKEMRALLTTKDGDVVLLGKPDTFCPITFKFREYKTGTTPWTQAKAQKHRQLDHYAAIIWVKHQKVPPEIHLDWAQTEVLEDGGIALTGGIKTFEVKKDLSDILKYLSDVARVAREIDAAYRQELKQLT